MKNNQSKYKLINLCKAMQVSKSGYYKYIKLEPNLVKLEIQKQVEICFKRHKYRSGAKKIHIDIAKTYKISSATVGRYMRKLGLKAKSRSKFKYKTTKSNYDAPNLLNRQFTALKPNHKWVTDITYLKANNTWHYLCVIIDLYSRKVIAWQFRHNMQTCLVTDTLKQALINRKIDYKYTDLMLHSDRGSQYTSLDFTTDLAKHNIKHSLSRPANCWDNAVAESFFKSLKSELSTQPAWSFERMKTELFEYIDIDYNSKRYHSTINYLSPNNFELSKV
jgi:transposase InsO family protein